MFRFLLLWSDKILINLYNIGGKKIIMMVKKVKQEEIKHAAEIIKSGGLVIYPTDTVYGLGADAFNRQAVLRVFEAKRRKLGKPISIAVASMEKAREIVEWNDSADVVAKKFLPGPLTIVLKKKANFPDELTGDKDKIGVRIPGHEVALKLIKLADRPITTTSANIAGRPNPRTAKEAIEQIGNKVEFVLDAGECKIGEPSTVVDLTEGKVKILRAGAISKKEIEEVLSLTDKL